MAATARELTKVKDLVKDHADTALALYLDVTAAAAVTAAVKQAEERFGQIDVLVNNADYGDLATIEEVEDGPVRKMFDTNVFALIDVTRAVLPGMRLRKADGLACGRTQARSTFS